VKEVFGPTTARLLLVTIGGADVTSTPAQIAGAIDQVWTELLAHFGNLLGAAGMRALQDRSISIASERLPWLAVPRQGSGVVTWSLRTVFERRPPSEAVAEFAHLMASLITLVGRLIGDAMVGRVLHEMWPEVFPRVAKEQS
jgi:hypothetical protein